MEQRCFWLHKNNNLKAIHNKIGNSEKYPQVVSGDTKIII